MGLLMLNGHAYAGFTEPAEIYSIEEREIGVWIDGKPLYQKSYYISTFPNASIAYIPHGMSNIGETVEIKGIAHIKLSVDSSDVWTQLSRVQDNNTNGLFAVDINGTNIVLKGRNSDFSGLYDKGYVTIQYTKTTDTAGSGRWSNAGDQTHHYSTSEQVVGTWVDGKPLYEKTYVNSGSDITANGGTWTTVCSESWAQNVKQITMSLFSRQAYSSSVAGISTPCEFIAESGVIKINPFRNLTFKTNAFFVIQYTKTSD